MIKQVDDIRLIKKANALFFQCVREGIIKYSEKWQLMNKFKDPERLFKFLKRKYEIYVENKQKRMF